jgi:hypothetical protein
MSWLQAGLGAKVAQHQTHLYGTWRMQPARSAAGCRKVCEAPMGMEVLSSFGYGDRHLEPNGRAWHHPYHPEHTNSQGAKAERCTRGGTFKCNTGYAYTQ